MRLLRAVVLEVSVSVKMVRGVRGYSFFPIVILMRQQKSHDLHHIRLRYEKSEKMLWPGKDN
jgi:hypothetical protein